MINDKPLLKEYLLQASLFGIEGAVPSGDDDPEFYAQLRI